MSWCEKLSNSLKARLSRQMLQAAALVAQLTRQALILNDASAAVRCGAVCAFLSLLWFVCAEVIIRSKVYCVEVVLLSCHVLLLNVAWCICVFCRLSHVCVHTVLHACEAWRH